MSRMMPMGEMLIGQASTHAWQLVQAQSSSSVIQFPNSVFPSGSHVPPLASRCWPISSMRSRVDIMILRGLKSLPVWLAGHSLVQRPHSVHV